MSKKKNVSKCETMAESCHKGKSRIPIFMRIEEMNYQLPFALPRYLINSIKLNKKLKHPFSLDYAKVCWKNKNKT